MTISKGTVIGAILGLLLSYVSFGDMVTYILTLFALVILVVQIVRDDW